MKKFYKITALLLSVLLCVGMMSTAAFAAQDLDFGDGYVIPYDKNGQPFGGVYEVGQVFEYELHLFVWDKVSEDYVEVPVLDTDSVSLYDALAETETLIATATGAKISWTATEAGYHEVELRLEREDNSPYYGYEVYQIGQPWDLAHAYIEYEGYELSDGETFIYDNTSIKTGLKVFFYPAGEYLKEGVDYTMKVTNAKGPGKATITVTGKGKCTGTIKLNVDIVSPSAPFKDVKQNGWYIKAVNFALTAGLFNGTSKTTFEPNSPMTRGMFVTVAVRLLGLDEAEVAPPLIFEDVPSKQYYAKPVAWASYLGIVNGVDATHFAPDQKITREQMCAMLVRLNDVVQKSMDEVGVELDLTMTPGGEQFKDHKKISSYAREAVYACRNEGIVSGKGGNTFDPKGNATRAEVATILLNYNLFLAGRAAAEA